MDAEFTLAGEDWYDAVRRLAKLGKLARPGQQDMMELIIDFEPRQLKLKHAGTSVSVSGNGIGTGTAILSGITVRPLATEARSLRKGALQVRVDSNRLKVGNLNLSIEWHAESSQAAPLPTNPTLRDLLRARYRYTEIELAQQGLAGVISAAEAEMEKLVESAAHALRPVGIPIDQLRAFVIDAIKEDLG